MDFTDQEKTIIDAIKNQFPPDQFEKFMALPEEQIKAQLKQIIAQQANAPEDQQCMFCKIVAGEIPISKVYEDDSVLAFLDINPANPGHTLVIPKNHYTVYPQMPDNEASKLFVSVKKVAAGVFEGVQAEGIEIRQNNSPVAGQVVPHVHVHVIPRYKNDGVKNAWEPKKMTDEQREEIKSRIASKIPKEIIEEQKPERPEVLEELKPRIP